MGVYNPRAPQILGQEWVPIREANEVISPAANLVEVGHSFIPTANRTLQQGRFYIKTPAPGGVNGQTMMMQVYPEGLEDDTGPISEVLIPVSNGGITGSNISLVGASTVAEALLDPSDIKRVDCYQDSANPQYLSLFFATNGYPILQGKRILAVNLVYVASGTFNLLNENQTNGGATPSFVFLTTDALGIGGVTYSSLTGAESADPPVRASNRFGEMNPFWNAGVNPSASSERQPWIFGGLQRMEASASNRFFTLIAFQIADLVTGTTPAHISLLYAALQVIYCQEQRVAVGGLAGISSASLGWVLGTNPITLRDPVSQTVNPVLTSGNPYTVTLAAADPGDFNFHLAVNFTYPTLNSCQELEGIPSHPVVQINHPFPPENHLGETFTKEIVHVVPQVTLNTSGAPLTEVHVYGRQAIAPVYGSINPTQNILDSLTASNPYPGVRFYARRFGDTIVPLRLDSPSITGSSVSITPAEFDALDEIIDGWKEITLRFTSPPTLGAGTNPTWRWSANGELAGNRWEVLGATAPALSGIPGNLYNLAPTPGPLGSATYGQPSSGTTIELTWISPPASGQAADSTSDAVLIFAQDLPAVTGLAITPAVQPLTGIGEDCLSVPCCIPSALRYNSISWGLPSGTGRGKDGFGRTVAPGGLGTADIGGAYTTTGTAADYQVTNDMAVVTPSANNASRIGTINSGGFDFDVTADLIMLSAADSSGTIQTGPVGRYTDANNFYRLQVLVNSSGVITTMDLLKNVGGSTTTLQSTVPVIAGGIGSRFTMRIVGMASGTSVYLKGKIWRTDETEPLMWDIETIDTSSLPPGGTRAGFSTRVNGSVTGISVGFDNLIITPPRPWFGSYELQRQDSLTDWQTIMKVTNPAVISFNDYEARVGIASSYRIRAIDNLGFPNSWSSTVVATAITAPGVTGGNCVDDGHLLLFTSNERQTGAINLAHATIWEGNSTVSEDFTFPESGFTALQLMYGKDFYTAFRPTERGGSRFTRTLLVQAAAISPETLPNFTSLRDMAWDQVSYVCVRDEDGNRWFASVMVPSGRVELNRSIYMAPVDIVEVTDTASEVDPEF